MNFDWKHYLDVADHLYSNCDYISDREACFRAAISRGYYSAFCTARNYARDNDCLTIRRSANDHKSIIQYYCESHGKSHSKKRRKQ